MLSATPIPRSLAQSFYGDLEISTIYHKPAQRKPIETRIISQQKMPELIAAIKRALAKDEKIYWLCPLIENSETLPMAAAEERYQKLV